MKKLFVYILSTFILNSYISLQLYCQKGNDLSGFTDLFNGLDFTNWIVPEGDNGHWKILDGVIDYDAESEAPGDKHLLTEKEYKDFILFVDWRIKETPYKHPRTRIILPTGMDKLDEKGKVINITVPSSDSGILLRGTSKTQVNIWCWPVGSGELWGFRTDESMPAEVRKAVTPKYNADKNIGEWNTFKIILKGNILKVELNGHVVIEDAELPGLPEKGQIGLQHHGKKKDGAWVGSPSLVQFRNIYIKEL